ncbi:MAG: DNA repair protein RecN [bacterium]|jgi:DNA repair protein RecN (Recombination protein N)|nr:DNA repair protein RecN [bacterium]
MLRNLHVENFALIDKIDVQFEPGLNIITGETGAGKSILIDALGSTIGEKIASDSLRKGATRAIAEGIFQINANLELKNHLRQYEIEDLSDTIILRKEISDNLRNRAFVNDSPVPNSLLIDVGNLLVDLHGQHEHQSLLNVNYHIQYLDDFGGYDQLLSSVAENYTTYLRLLDDLKLLKARERTLAEKRDLYRFQVEEIKSINPYAGEEEDLLQEEKILQNSEKLFQLTTELFNDFYDAEGSVYDRISDGLKKLDELAAVDDRFNNLKADCDAARVAIEEVAKFVQGYFSNIEFNPDRLEQIRVRLGQFALLKKKYHRSMDEIIVYREQIEQELQDIESIDATISAKQQEIDAQQTGLSQACQLLSEQRKQVAVQLEKQVLEKLGQLGMKNAKFKIQVEWLADENGAVMLGNSRYKTSEQGLDQVEFYIAANPGEDLKPLARVASGGEISRIMLALKSSLAQVDKIPVLIFDEIDMGISGRIAQAVGLALKRLSRTHQIICITHLPQIASMGEHHFVVEKISDQASTRTQIRKLTTDERAFEIAKLLGGESVTDTHVRAALELIEEANRFRNAD